MRLVPPTGRCAMILLYLSIPLMLLGVAIATLPLLAAMRAETRADRTRLAWGRPEPVVPDREPLAA